MFTMKHSLFVITLCLLVPCYISLRGDPVGCYAPRPDRMDVQTEGNVDLCLKSCESMYYRYAILSNGSKCFCDNMPGLVVADPSMCNNTCRLNSSQLCGGDKASNAYDTGILVPGPPTQLSITNITETSLYLEWGEPNAHGIITEYKVKCKVIHTFDPENERKDVEWLFPNSTFHAQLEDLHPGTTYNVSVCAFSREGTGAGIEAVYQVETIIGVPEPSPLEATILEKQGDHMLISIPRSTNINGPITKYRIIVINQQYQQGFLPEFLRSYEEATKEGLSFYITAQIEPRDIEQNFVVGNRRTYDGYYNAPLPKHTDIEIAIGVVSIKNEVTKDRYTHSTDITILTVREKEETSSMILLLGVAVVIGVILLLAGLAVILVLRRRVGLIRRQRLSQSMPLSGPCIEIENTGFIPDEENRVDHYGNLKRQLWNIPRNFLEVDTSSMIGMGNFGRFIRARVQHQGSFKPAIVQVVPDGELSKPDKKQMFSELDQLIKANGHENVITLIGICEIPETLYVVLEGNRHTLKELLLSSRHTDLQNNKFSVISEEEIIKIAIGVSKGMEYLSSNKLFHKRLCCRNIIMTDGNTPKVSGFGLSHIHAINEKPDYTRWTAIEMFKKNIFHVKSDVWSFGCLLWEMFSLGGTLYPNIISKDIPARVMKGSRPPQLHYLGDDLYQICLHCWQLDLDERPTFPELTDSLESVLSQDIASLLDFTHHDGFDYETQIRELEALYLM